MKEEDLKHGALPHTPDSRDFHYSEIAKSSAPFDWTQGIDVQPIRIKDQGSSESCGGQAWSYFMGVLKGDDRSAKFIYSQTAAPGGGSDGRTNCDLVVKQGDCQETLCTSNKPDGSCDEEYMTNQGDITAQARTDATTDEALSYAQVATDFDSLAQAIRDNKGVIIGIQGENNGTWTSTYPQPPVNPTWNHWVWACKAKLLGGKKYIGFANSWGTQVGDQGIQWISESYIPFIFVAWTLYAGKYIFNTDMQMGQTSADVQQLQRKLIALGYPIPAGATSFYGSQTRNAVYDFQLDHVPMNLIEKYVYLGRYCGVKTRQALNNL